LPTRIAILTIYLGALIAVGAAGRRARRPGAEDFFLAGRALGPVVLFATMAATNFSGFAVVGFSGAGYRLGFAFYPVMAFGTGFMALAFFLVGIPIHRLGKAYGLITPPELLGARFGPGPLTVIFGLAMAVFTIPYLAIQPMAAGYALESLLGLPYPAGAGLITALVLGYVLMGGMRSVAWTDLLQGLFMLGLMLAGFFVVAAASGGPVSGFAEVARFSVEHLMRPGAGGGLPVGIWASYMLLWFLADPMFPQLFQRFYAARGETSIVRTAVLYPLLTSVLFFFPVAIGVLGRLHVPGLEGRDTDRILPILMERLGGDWLAALAAAGLIAAIMSTMDSQLLTMGSIVERDLLGRGLPGRARRSARTRALPPGVTRLVLAGLALLGYALALRPPATILAIATETFAGLAVLFPTLVASIYWDRATARACLVSILLGEAWVVLSHFGVVPQFGVLAALPAVAVAGVALLTAAFLGGGTHGRPRAFRALAALGLTKRQTVIWSAVFGCFLFLSVDWWRFGKLPTLLFGLPDWVLYFAALGGLLACAFGLFGRTIVSRDRAPRSPML